MVMQVAEGGGRASAPAEERMTTAKAYDATKISAGSSRVRAIGRVADSVGGGWAVLGVASLIKGWNWSETFTVVPYVVFEAGVVVFGMFQGKAKA